MEPRPGAALDSPRCPGGNPERNSDGASAGEGSAWRVSFLLHPPVPSPAHDWTHRECQRRRELSDPCFALDLRGSPVVARKALASHLFDRSALSFCTPGVDRGVHFDRGARCGPSLVLCDVGPDAPQACVSRRIPCPYYSAPRCCGRLACVEKSQCPATLARNCLRRASGALEPGPARQVFRLADDRRHDRGPSTLGTR